MARTIVETAIPYPLIWDEGQVDIRFRDDVFRVQFKRRYRQEGDDTSIPGAATANNVELRYDRLARVAHTKVAIFFPRYVEDQSQLVPLVHAILNRLLDVYRFTTGEFYVDAIPRNELWPCEIFTVDDDGELSPEIAHMESFGYGLTLARKASIPNETRQILFSGTELSIPQTLYLNARREELLENYRLAVVEAETGFEARVDEVVSRYYKNEGRSPTEIDNILNAGLKNLIKDHVPKSCDQPFVGTEEHKNWETDLYKLRNDIVHQGKSVNADAARKALEAAQKALEWLANRASR